MSRWLDPNYDPAGIKDGLEGLSDKSLFGLDPLDTFDFDSDYGSEWEDGKWDPDEDSDLEEILEYLVELICRCLGIDFGDY